MIVLGGREVPVRCRVRQELDRLQGWYATRGPGPLERLILHHDAALSAEGCISVLNRRRLSTHFVIDNDGTVVQLLDPLVHTAWATGRYNTSSIAVDVSNACELRYADRYDPPRPVITQRIHGCRVRWLGPYPCQEEALRELVRVLCVECGIPAVVPLDEAGEPILRVLDPVPHGVVGHLHCDRRKVDPYGLDWRALV